MSPKARLQKKLNGLRKFYLDAGADEALMLVRILQEFALNIGEDAPIAERALQIMRDSE